MLPNFDLSQQNIKEIVTNFFSPCVRSLGEREREREGFKRNSSSPPTFDTNIHVTSQVPTCPITSCLTILEFGSRNSFTYERSLKIVALEGSASFIDGTFGVRCTLFN